MSRLGIRPGVNNKKKVGGPGISHKPVAFLQRLNRLTGPCLGSRRVTPVIFDNLVYELNCECVHTIG